MSGLSPRDRSEHWVGTWTTAPAPIEGVRLGDQTVRLIAHISIGGPSLRVRLSNAHGNQRLRVGGVHVALRGEGAAVRPESDRTVTFDGSLTTVIAAGALAVSDPVVLEIPPLVDLAVSIYLPDELVAPFQITGHGNAHQTGYISPRGDFGGASVLPDHQTTESVFFLSGIDVLADGQIGGIVAFGDSLTDGNLSKLDANYRWPDELARRLAARGGRLLGVMNQGIGGNRILHDVRGDSGLRRFDRDVLAQPGVTHVIVLLGINDIRNRQQKAEEVVTADEMIAGLHQLALRGQ
ncbi:MAG TPA: GDSL-type esterase/lipase family protein, partial [Chloroflexota bacterium]